jgi:non-heme chloroperoxidase
LPNARGHYQKALLGPALGEASLLTVKLLKKGTLKLYEKLLHGMSTTRIEIVKPDLHSFLRD